VFLDGRVHVISTSPAAGPTARRDDEFALAAPMPATVAAVHATPGQQVARGDVLITLEAMKMELAIKAPRDGRVRAVACRAGDLVQPGVPLIELE
jgi:3-methylcrotonyl-CoA carboxylase alpha subunit